MGGRGRGCRLGLIWGSVAADRVFVDSKNRAVIGVFYFLFLMLMLLLLLFF